MLIKQSVTDALNKQVVEEFAASAQYLAIALYFDRETLPELTGYFQLQSQEEYGHATKLLQYVNDAGAHPIVPAIPPLKNDFESVEECIQLALNQELQVTDQINALVALAEKENDFLTRQFLQWFVTEQLEEVSSMSDLLAIVRRAGDNLFYVEEYLSRTPHPEAAGAGGA
ncbi:MAG: ferritin [Anaerolineae bacterium]